MLTKVKASKRNPYNNAVDRSVEFTMDRSSPYVVKEITGLGPVKNDVSRSQNSVDRGSEGQSSRAVERNIVFQIGFRPGVSVDIQRQELLRVYMPGAPVELEFETTNLGPVTIRGTVETSEPTIFSKEPSHSISIICYDPYFTGVDQKKTFIPKAESFPVFSVPFEGNVPTGFTFEFRLVDTVDQVSLFRMPYQSQGSLVLNYKFQTGDIVRFNTAKGSRSVELIRDKIARNMLAYFEGSLVAMKLDPGQNWFRFNDYGRSDQYKFTYETLIGSI